MHPFKNGSAEQTEHQSYQLSSVENHPPSNQGANKPVSQEKTQNGNIVYRATLLAVVETVMAYINENPIENKSANDFALETNVSRGRLQKFFKEKTGKGIEQYRNDLRLEISLSMLREQKKTMKQIARHWGYTQNYFTRIFKKKYGMTPSQWQRRNSSNHNGN